MNVSVNFLKNAFGEVVGEKTWLEGVQELMRKEAEDSKYTTAFPRIFSVKENREMECYSWTEK